MVMSVPPVEGQGGAYVSTPTSPHDPGTKFNYKASQSLPCDKFEKKTGKPEKKSKKEKDDKDKESKKPNLGLAANACAVLGGAASWIAAAKFLRPILPFRYLGIVAAATTYLGTLGAFSAAKQKREEGQVDKRQVVGDVVSNMVKSLLYALFPV